jgi:hypothetical protein
VCPEDGKSPPDPANKGSEAEEKASDTPKPYELEECVLPESYFFRSLLDEKIKAPRDKWPDVFWDGDVLICIWRRLHTPRRML